MSVDRRQFIQTAAAFASGLFVGSSDSLRACSKSAALQFQKLRTDQFRLVFPSSHERSLRILQLADTHFHPGDDTNSRTQHAIRSMVEQQKPDLIVHTGDFVNNDAEEAVEWSGMDLMNSLNCPWTLCFGNHDYPVNKAPGSRSLSEVHGMMENGYQGYWESEGKRSYCYRYDVFASDSEQQPRSCLFFFQVGYSAGDRRISDHQLQWFDQQIKADLKSGIDAPIMVFVHIPLLEYHTLFSSGTALGQKGEDVCYDSDTGSSFAAFQKSGRVTAVYCGHDHVNNFFGPWQGVQLVYGRLSGWGGYGPADWKRGGRLITLDLSQTQSRPVFDEVFPS